MVSGKDARDVPVYDCYVTSINVDPDGWREKPAQEDIIFCGGLKLGAPRESSYSIKEYAYRRIW